MANRSANVFLIQLTLQKTCATNYTSLSPHFRSWATNGRGQSTTTAGLSFSLAANLIGCFLPVRRGQIIFVRCQIKTPLLNPCYSVPPRMLLSVVNWLNLDPPVPSFMQVIGRLLARYPLPRNSFLRPLAARGDPNGHTRSAVSLRLIRIKSSDLHVNQFNTWYMRDEEAIAHRHIGYESAASLGGRRFIYTPSVAE
jgi:hypothetical protein